MKPTYPVIDVLAIAVAAFEFNNQRVERNPITVNGRGLYPNRQLIKDYFEGDREHIKGINDFNRKQAEGIIEYLQQVVIIRTLSTAKVDSFLGEITALLANQEIKSSEFGLIAWAPKLADDYQRKDHVKQLSAHYEKNSNYIGKPGDKITTAFTLIEKRYLKKFDCWSVYGYDANDNLISYLASELDKVCEVGTISGRVKMHRADSYRNNAKVTTLNYVKVL